MKCLHCNTENEQDALFCISCGKELPKHKICPQCGAELEEECDWCTQCGAKQPNQAEEPLQTEKSAKEVQAAEEEKETTVSTAPKSYKKILYLLGAVAIICVTCWIFIPKEDPTAEMKREMEKKREEIRVQQKKERIEMERKIMIEAQNRQLEKLKEEKAIAERAKKEAFSISDVSVMASHVLAPQGNNHYKASNLLDGDISTIWATPNTGEAEKLTFSMNARNLSTITICNGYGKSETSYKNNRRAGEIEIYIDGVFDCRTELKDTWMPQHISLDKVYPIVRKVEITILSIYEGEKWNDLCISEVSFHGKEIENF